MNELDLALQAADIGFDLANQWGSYDSISLGIFNLAKIYQAMGNYNKAVIFLRDFKETYPSKNRHQYRLASTLEAEISLRSGSGLALMGSGLGGLQKENPIRI